MVSPNVPANQVATRLISLDVLRGLTVAFMILVNNAGDGERSYGQLRHSVWSGCTLTDLVFPMFLFIMGVSMALSFEGRLAKGVPPGGIALQVLRRATVIVGLGLLLNALPNFDLAGLRYCGVLQRIGICYLVGSLVLLYLRPLGTAIVAVLATVGYWVLLTKVAVPGVGYPGIDVAVLDPVNNLASYVDRLLIPQIHRYHHSFYDVEGVLSTIPALATVLAGTLTALWLRHPMAPGRRLGGMALASAMLLAGAFAWSRSLPFNKRLWTSSYVLLTAGVSIGLFALLIWIVDEKGWFPRLRTPWLVFGTNALAAYILSEIVSIAIGSIHFAQGETVQQWLYQLLPKALGPDGFRSLVWSVLFDAACFLPMLALYRKRIFIKL
jgi:predicted acyltransferase